MSEQVLPGQVLPPSILPKPPPKANKGLRVGPGLQQVGDQELRVVAAGTVATDNKKNAAWIEVPDGRYAPTLNDPVLATVLRSTGDSFMCSVAAHSPPAMLPHMAFEGVTKKTRPQLPSGTLVYARVSSCSRFQEPELTCVDTGGGGIPNAAGLGELKGGMVWDISLGFARRLLVNRQRERGGVAVLEELSEKGLAFEIVVGKNGKVWVKADDGSGGSVATRRTLAGGVRATLVVGRALTETDRGNLGIEGQKKLVKRLMKIL